MEKPSFVNISKLDVAKRELEHSIRLFFSCGDIIVIHLVSSAAQEVLSDLGKESGTVSISTYTQKHVKKDKQEFVLRKLRQANNFFKHADKDPNELLKFNPETSEFIIWDSVNLYQSLTKEITGLMMAFRLWFFAKHSDLLIEREVKEAFKLVGAQLDTGNRPLFLELAADFEIKRLK